MSAYFVLAFLMYLAIIPGFIAKEPGAKNFFGKMEGKMVEKNSKEEGIALEDTSENNQKKLEEKISSDSNYVNQWETVETGQSDGKFSGKTKKR
jgi:hypothetical protein